MRIRKINNQYYRLQRNKMYSITKFQAQKLIKKGAVELKEIDMK